MISHLTNELPGSIHGIARESKFVLVLESVLESLLSERTNLSVESTFITGRLVFVYQAFTRHMIKNRNRFLVSGFCRTLVSACDGGEHPLYHRAHHGALASVTLAGFFGLANAFARLCCVCHELPSDWSMLNSASHYVWLVSPRQSLFA